MNYIQPIPTTMRHEDLLQAMYSCMENSDDGFLIVDTDGKIAYINDAYCQYIGINRFSVIGKDVLDYIDTSKMPEIALDTHYPSEVSTLHEATSKQYLDKEPYVYVNRTNVSINNRPIAASAQIKFVRTTLKLSESLFDIYNELSYYKQELKCLSSERFSFDNIIGNSKKLADVKRMALKASENDFPVMITGETGTGKEVFANAIHYASRRKGKPMISINCAAIPSELLESELFGYEGGAFTGAKKSGKQGKFELANGGTLFLDEIGDMPLVMQAKLLRALQEKEIEHIGGTKPIPVDVRIICATNKNLIDEIENHNFRSDLYFRLNVIQLKLPPLRERQDDIDLCADHFLFELNEKYHSSIRLSNKAKQQFHNYSWPGNIRELKNIIERGYALQENGMITYTATPDAILTGTSYHGIEGNTLEEKMDNFEKQILLETVRNYNGNLRQTAQALGIHRVTLYKKLEKHGIHREDF